MTMPNLQEIEQMDPERLFDLSLELSRLRDYLAALSLAKRRLTNEDQKFWQKWAEEQKAKLPEWLLT